MARPRQVTALSAVTATGASAIAETFGHPFVTMQVNASSVTTGATVKLQGSNDGTNWVDLASRAVSANGFTFDSSVATGGVIIPCAYVRANITARTDGTYTVLLYMTGQAGTGP